MLNFNSHDMLQGYLYLNNGSSEFEGLDKMWPLDCAQVRDPNTYTNNKFHLSHLDVTNVKVGSLSFDWINAEAGRKMALMMGIDNVDCISACDSRLAFLEDGLKCYGHLMEDELRFISGFISALVWLTPNNDAADNGNASFYELPHITFVSDATLFFIPPFHQIPREFGIFGFVENLYHEALHHQVHAYNALNEKHYCYDQRDDCILDLPYRNDRTFSYSQAFNACYVYSEIVKFREKSLNFLLTKEDTKDNLWLSDASISAKSMWIHLTKALFNIREYFLPQWRNMIESWNKEIELMDTGIGL
ncbi:hypothetical protein [Aeromonas sp. MdU4]|uniref:hypothetical protein n=1 Tax=Aeromonas sp. MdU4 TaxID=3342819 RepID=UPI0035B750C0